VRRSGDGKALVTGLRDGGFGVALRVAADAAVVGSWAAPIPPASSAPDGGGEDTGATTL
jgi:hypothetical protein